MKFLGFAVFFLLLLALISDVSGLFCNGTRRAGLGRGRGGAVPGANGQVPGSGFPGQTGVNTEFAGGPPGGNGMGTMIPGDQVFNNG